jgi:hypothetical protein
MTRGTFVSDIFKNKIDVAGAASDLGVAGAQWIARLGVVIELRTLADGRPARSSMTSIAADWQWTVRIMSARSVLPPGQEGQQHK